jgi:hypothetical protein
MYWARWFAASAWYSIGGPVIRARDSTGEPKVFSTNSTAIRRGADDKSLACPIFISAAQPKEFFLDVLKKLEQRSHKCVELRGEYVE